MGGRANDDAFWRDTAELDLTWMRGLIDVGEGTSIEGHYDTIKWYRRPFRMILDSLEEHTAIVLAYYLGYVGNMNCGFHENLNSGSAIRTRAPSGSDA